MLCDINLLSELVSLKFLFLKNNHIIKTNALIKLTNLCELDLESNEISEISELKNWENHEVIAVLNMKGNPVIR